MSAHCRQQLAGGELATPPSAHSSAATRTVSSPAVSQHQRSGEITNQRYSNLIYDSELFLTKLREFKPQSLGCLEARRKSSSTLIFPNPQQACMGPPKCAKYPHSVKPTPGYWIECHGPGILARSAAAAVSGVSGIDQRVAADSYISPNHSPRGSPSRLEDLRLIIDCSSGASSRSSGHTPVDIGNRFSRQESHERFDDQSIPRRSSQEIQPSHGNPFTSQTTSANKSKHPVLSKKESISGFDLRYNDNPCQTKTDQLAANPSKPGDTVDRRKRLNKRTMTRDDIDLHRQRRGTPNITITEPSFNQSTVTYLPTSRQNRTYRQASQSSDVGRMDSVDSTYCEPVSPPLPPTDYSSYTDGDVAFATNMRRQESFTSDQSTTQNESNVLNFRPYRPHRPSVICEDADLEAEGSDRDTKEQKEFYCGLSTTTFHKKPYQQAFQLTTQSTDQFRDGSLELISFEEENYEKHYYGREHWNYFTNDELLGPVMLSLKQEVNNQRDHFHVLLRTVSYTLHGTIPASTICADRYDREAIVRELSEIAKLKPPLMLGQLPSTPDDLLKLDHIFIKTELKVGVIYIKSGQAESEEAILGNRDESPLFTEFLDLLGDRITLKGFDRYKGGLDTVHNLTGTESVYTLWRNIEIMFHISTMLPHEDNDPQKLQKKRHIGNDIVCVAFIESDDVLFWPGCIKSYFLHTFITVRTSPKPLKEGEKRKYSVSCVCRNEVQYAFKPYLVEQDEFCKSDYFREWLLVKIVNGERASYSAPKFARMQDRTRSQLLEDIITNLANHLVTGQIPKPYRRGSWRPLGHTRASSPLEDLMKDYFEDYDQLAKDFSSAFCGPSRSMLCDVVFRVRDHDGSYKLVHGVRAIMAIRSRTFLEMLYGFVPPGAGPTNLQNRTNLRAIEMKALSGESSSGPNREVPDNTKSLLAKRGSFGADPTKKIEKERRQSMLPTISKSNSQKPNYLTVPSASGNDGAGASNTGGMIKNAFNRLVSGNWSNWSGNMKGYKAESMHIKVDQNKTKVDLSSLAICKEIAKIDADKLSRREFEIKEFDYETFQQTIEYIHNGQCKLSYETIPGLICAAEHYDLPDLLHACFHHANTHMKLSAAPRMMNALYQNSCFYVTAMQLLDSIYEYIDPQGSEFFTMPEYLELYESVFTTLLSRKSLQISELGKFKSMQGWAEYHLAQKRQEKLQKQQSIDPDKPEIEKEQPNLEVKDLEHRLLMIRLNKDINIKLDKISNEDLVKIVLPAKVFENKKIFAIMADESRTDYY